MLTLTRRLGCERLAKNSVGHGVPRIYRTLSNRNEEIELKYADKLRERSKREGMSGVEELKAKVFAQMKQLKGGQVDGEGSRDHSIAARRDGSPVQPLTNFMNIQKIQAKEHTTEQISALWTGYHATRSQGTGLGYLSAVVPLTTYLKMVSRAKQYPMFIIPLARTVSKAAERIAHEFHFLQWDFHEIPQMPRKQLRAQAMGDNGLSNPPYSSVLLTPLLEYKVRGTFAQPHLVLTHYTDLATTHGVVLMRGEITRSSSSVSTFLLSQADAQLLALGVQRVYLAGEDDRSEGLCKLLEQFHEEPENFRWEDVIKFADLRI